MSELNVSHLLKYGGGKVVEGEEESLKEVADGDESFL